MRTRLLIGGVGVLMGAFGALRFLQLDFADIVNAVLFLAGGVIVHDGFIAPLTVALGLPGHPRGAPPDAHRGDRWDWSCSAPSP